MYDPGSPLAVRVVARESEQLGDALVLERLERARSWRERLFPRDGQSQKGSVSARSSGYRLLNGEGDGLPGLVCDRYGDHAVIKLDGDGPSGFWNLPGIAAWLVERVGVSSVYLKYRSGEEELGRAIVGDPPKGPVQFTEHGVLFQADIVKGQKTGFFFDQRDNRRRIGALSSGRTVLNLFGYTGGFSVYAGLGGATAVTTVDLAKPAIQDAEQNWALNNLPAARHRGVAADAFQFLEEARSSQERWDIVIADPPSFAPAERHVEKAKESYQSLFRSSILSTKDGGIVACSSCSSHISLGDFLEICQGAASKARRRATVLGIYGQPEDHPFPLVCEELRYLKFVTLGIHG
jgi:23S rRNA (cytosine1962-C5)-methyltransferase